MSYRHRKRAVLEVESVLVTKSVNARRVAVSSTDWLDDRRAMSMRVFSC